MRRLARTLIAGGVVYPAGTREDDIAAQVTRDDVWTDEGGYEPEAEPEPEPEAPKSRGRRAKG